MTRPIGLHQITAMDVEPLEFVKIAASCGCGGVSVFTYSPKATLPGQRSRLLFPTITNEMKLEIQGSLDANRVAVIGVEFFPRRWPRRDCWWMGRCRAADPAQIAHAEAQDVRTAYGGRTILESLDGARRWRVGCAVKTALRFLRRRRHSKLGRSI
jgi:hypothetical protein